TEWDKAGLLMSRRCGKRSLSRWPQNDPPSAYYAGLSRRSFSVGRSSAEVASLACPRSCSHVAVRREWILAMIDEVERPPTGRWLQDRRLEDNTRYCSLCNGVLP